MKDSVVCHIKDNPELVIINLSCWGVWPELELESKHLHFDRILLHRYENMEYQIREDKLFFCNSLTRGFHKVQQTREWSSMTESKYCTSATAIVTYPSAFSSFNLPSSIVLYRRDSRSVTLHNKTALPVSWRLQGVEELGDEFSVPQDQGIISPNSSFPLSLHFRARKPLHIKKILRLEVEKMHVLKLAITHICLHVCTEYAVCFVLGIRCGEDFRHRTHRKHKGHC